MARLQGAVIATAQCFGTAGRLALAPVADWLRNDAVRSAVATLDPAFRAEVARLVPASGGGTSSRVTADAWQRHRFLEGLARALIAVQRPLLLVLDNVQWCDQETLAFITFCLGLADDARLLVAATLRQDDLDEDPELAGWIVRMQATGLLTEVPLSPLEAADTARLAQAISGQPLPEARADLLHAATGGFPLYVIEAARGIADPGGTSLPVGDLAARARRSSITLHASCPSLACADVPKLPRCRGRDQAIPCAWRPERLRSRAAGPVRARWSCTRVTIEWSRSRRAGCWPR